HHHMTATDATIHPRVKAARPSPAAATTARIPTAAHSQPAKVLNPSVANHAAMFAVVATQTHPRYKPKVPSVNNTSVVEDGDVARRISKIRRSTASRTTMTATLTSSSSS